MGWSPFNPESSPPSDVLSLTFRSLPSWLWVPFIVISFLRLIYCHGNRRHCQGSFERCFFIRGRRSCAEIGSSTEESFPGNSLFVFSSVSISTSQSMVSAGYVPSELSPSGIFRFPSIDTSIPAARPARRGEIRLVSYLPLVLLLSEKRLFRFIPRTEQNFFDSSFKFSVGSSIGGDAGHLHFPLDELCS